jgi:hypothetical protein
MKYVFIKCAREGCNNLNKRGGRSKYCCGDCKRIVDKQRREEKRKSQQRSEQNNNQSI